MNGFQRQETRKARQAHRCSECQVKIQRGEAYVAISGVEDGDWYAHKLCATCDQVWKVCWENAKRLWFDSGDGVPIGFLRDHLRDIDVLLVHDGKTSLDERFADLLVFDPARLGLPVRAAVVEGAA